MCFFFFYFLFASFWAENRRDRFLFLCDALDITFRVFFLVRHENDTLPSTRPLLCRLVYVDEKRPEEEEEEEAKYNIRSSCQNFTIYLSSVLSFSLSL